jgi:type I restriction enzyme S subunit
MRSKGDSEMQKATQAQEVVPQLRFPEFQGEWSFRTLGNEGEFLSSLTGKKGADFGTGDAKFITYMNVFANTFVDAKDLRAVNVGMEESQNPVQKGDLLFTISSETPEEAGMSSVLLEDIANCYVNSFCAVFRFDDGKAPNPVFTGYLLRRPAARTYFSAKAQGSTRFNLSKVAFRSVPLLVPETGEQQKIADCLSSLDACIDAETRKLDALKTHKQGLMRQLFPHEGEILPCLRFPQFRDAPEWCVDAIGKLFDTSSGGTPDRAVKQYWDGNIPWITTSLIDFNVIHMADEFISDAGLKESSAKLFPENTLLVAMYGQGKTRGKVALLGIQAATNQACAAILPSKKVDPFFAFLSLCGRYDEIRGLSNSGGQENLSQGLIRELPFRYPSDAAEQRMIVGCLSSLDDLISAQTRKITALQLQKTGLMQGLFPAAVARTA